MRTTSINTNSVNLTRLVVIHGRTQNVAAIRGALASYVVRKPLELLPPLRDKISKWALQIAVEIDNNLIRARSKARDGVMPPWYRSAQAELHAEARAVECVRQVIDQLAIDLRPREHVAPAPKGWDKVETSVPAPETITVIQAAPLPKPRARKVKGPAQSRCETTLKGLESLGEYLSTMDEKAALDGVYHGE